MIDWPLGRAYLEGPVTGFQPSGLSHVSTLGHMLAFQIPTEWALRRNVAF